MFWQTFIAWFYFKIVYDSDNVFKLFFKILNLFSINAVDGMKFQQKQVL